jgi:aspartyl-tRNA synthetase
MNGTVIPCHNPYFQTAIDGGMDKYFQIVKCFQGEDLHRQPSPLNCEMKWIRNECWIDRHLLKEIKESEVDKFLRMTCRNAVKAWNKPDVVLGCNLEN